MIQENQIEMIIGEWVYRYLHFFFSGEPVPVSAKYNRIRSSPPFGAGPAGRTYGKSASNKYHSTVWRFFSSLFARGEKMRNTYRVPRSVNPTHFPSVSGTKSSAAELTQKRKPVGGGPSSNTWPRWPSQRAQRISMRCIPWLLSGIRRTALSAIMLE